MLVGGGLPIAFERMFAYSWSDSRLLPLAASLAIVERE
jgi:hypothetical protein